MKKQVRKRAVVSVVGKDKVGTVASVSNFMAQNKINIEEISQNIMDDIFTMIMLVDLEKTSYNVAELSVQLKKLGKKIGHEIHVHDEKIINAMHRI